MDIGNKLKELRVLKGLTQEELADRSELSKGFISQLERNLTSLPSPPLWTSCSALVPVSESFSTRLLMNRSYSENRTILLRKTPNTKTRSNGSFPMPRKIP